MNLEVIHACVKGSADGTLKFPEVVKKLMDIGVERYTADLVRLEDTFYSRKDESVNEKIPVTALPKVAQHFSAEGVQNAIRASQQGKIDYKEFLRLVMNAGTASYVVYLDGRQAIYYGRKGECHIEKFPN